MKGVGEPCAGEPHARFDGRGLETERNSVTAPAPDPTNLRSTPELRKAAKVNAVACFLLFVYVWLVVAGYDVWALLLLIATGAWLVWRLWRTKR